MIIIISSSSSQNSRSYSEGLEIPQIPEYWLASASKCPSSRFRARMLLINN